MGQRVASCRCVYCPSSSLVGSGGLVLSHSNDSWIQCLIMLQLCMARENEVGEGAGKKRVGGEQTNHLELEYGYLFLTFKASCLFSMYVYKLHNHI